MPGIVNQFLSCAIMFAIAYYAYRHPENYGHPLKFPAKFVRALMLAIMVAVVAAFVIALFNPKMWE